MSWIPGGAVCALAMGLAAMAGCDDGGNSGGGKFTVKDAAVDSPDGAEAGDGGGTADAAIGAATLRINEVMPVNDATLMDEFGEFNDWIELYNGGPEVVNLAGYWLGDEDASPLQTKLTDALVIGPGEVLLLWADKDLDQGPNHLSFALSAAAEVVVLSDPQGRVVDRFAWTGAVAEESFARFPDGTGEFSVCAASTPGEPNGDACAP